MRSFKKNIFSFLAVLFTLIVNVQSVSAIETAYQLGRFHHEETLKPDNSITINNPYGDIRIRQSASKTMTIHAVFQIIDNSFSKPEMKINRKEHNLSFNFIYPKNKAPERLVDGRIDLVAFMPSETPLNINIERGKLHSKSITNPLTVFSDSSDIDLVTSGTTHIYSRTGIINLKLIKKTPTNTAIKTSTGDINITYQMDSNIQFNIKTSTSITSNNVELLNSKTKKDDHYILSQGTTEHILKIISDTGHVRLINQN